LIVNFIYLLISILLAFAVAIWLYYAQKKKFHSISKVLFLLRFISVLALLLVLFNPKWKRQVLTNHKPQLTVLADNSLSIKSLGFDKKLVEIIAKIKSDQNLSEKFEVQFLTFGSEVKVGDSLRFDEMESNFSTILSQVNDIGNSFEKHPVLLLTDGNQTQGSDYSYFKSKNPIYPVVLGDTTKYSDLSISQLNANVYTFLENEFPVEILVNYAGRGNAVSQLTIFKNNQKVFQKTLQLDHQNNTENVTFFLKAEEVGSHYYTAQLSALNGEKNTHNNRKDFWVEVVDQQAKVLILSSHYHPDLGAIKQSIESNKQRKVTLSIGGIKDLKLTDFQLVILYQPTSEMGSILKDLLVAKKNVFFITGTKTDWDYLNKNQTYFSKKTTQLKEQYRGVYNVNYPNFSLQDFAIENLPPLQDLFGEIEMKTQHEDILFQKVGNTQLETPLLSTFQVNQNKYAVLFGEGLWQWKMKSKLDKQSFEPFDQFINAIVQYCGEDTQTNPIKLDFDKLLYSNQNQWIKAQYFDQNFQLDTRAQLLITLTDLQTQKSQKLPMVLNTKSYEAVFKNLKPGNYAFKVNVEGKNITQSGNFKVLDYSAEEQFTSAQYDKLNILAQNSDGTVVLANQVDLMLKQLYENPNFKNIQKNTVKTTPLIDWKWLLAIIIVSLSTEWFIRKYRGLV
jgi:hypothetical protein